MNPLITLAGAALAFFLFHNGEVSTTSIPTDEIKLDGVIQKRTRKRKKK